MTPSSAALRAVKSFGCCAMPGPKKCICVSALPTISPCYYGIDTPTRSELIASSSSVEDIRHFIEADTLAYLSREGMYTEFRSQKNGFCDACFSGNYPVHFEDEGHTRQLHLFEAIEQR